MNNLICAEKVLKHYLKQKISITTAAVVGFLIMGSVSFGAQIEDKIISNTETSTVESYHNVIVQETGKVEVSVNKAAPPTIGISLLHTNPLTVKNAGMVTVKNTEGEAKGVRFDPSGSKLFNTGTITVEGKTETQGVQGDTGKELFVTNGVEGNNYKPGAKIEVISETGLATAVQINGSGSLDNYGMIKATSNGASSFAKAVDLTQKGNVINEGTISAIASNGEAIGVNIENKDSSIINTGNIEASGKITRGITVKAGTEITNSSIAKIVALGQDSGTGVSLTESNINNSGLIYGAAKNGNAYGISAVVTESYTGIDPIIKNNKDGIIIGETEGNGWSSAIRLENVKKENVALNVINNGVLAAGGTGSAKTHVVDLVGKGQINFVNEKNGLIVVGEGSKSGVAIYSEENGNITNKGTITLEQGVINGTGILTGSTGGTVNIKNEGMIELALQNSDGTETNNVAINIKGNGTAENTGKIKITDKTAEELSAMKDFDANSLFNGNKDTVNKGMIVDKNGKSIILEEESVYLDDNNLTTDRINEEGKSKDSVTLGKLSKDEIDNRTTISGGISPINLGALNFVGKVWVGNTDTPTTIKVDSGVMNFDINGLLTVSAENTFEVNGSRISGEGKETITLEDNSTLNLNDTAVNTADITGTGTVNTKGQTTVSSNIASKSLNILEGNTDITGKINIGTLEVKDLSSLTLASNSSFGTAATITSKGTGTTIFDIDSNGENALSNSTAPVTVIGKVDFNTSNLTENTTVDLDNEETAIFHDLKQADYEDKMHGIYKTHLDKHNNTLNFTYNDKLFDSPELNSVNNAMQEINNKVTQNEQERELLTDNIYSGNIYSETVRASYESLQLNEETILSLGRTAKTGETTAHGKTLYSKNKYEKIGVKNIFNTDIETTGLLAGIEYGISNNMSVGTVFSGTTQHINTEKGNAEGKLFYIGLYTNHKVGNYDWTAGTGYQFGKYIADNDIISDTGDKYDSNMVSTYIQGRYTADLGDGVLVQPRVKLGHSYLNQTNTRDREFGVKDADISVFNIETGFDVVKSLQFVQSKFDIIFGTSFVKTLGDNDKEFRGEFYGNNTSNEFDVLGAHLTESILRFNLGAQLENEKGFFYNTGLTYEFGSDNTKVYGANLGIGYKF